MSDGVGFGKVNYSEPAIPVIAPVPLVSLKELLDTAARDWPTATRDGAQIALKVDARGVSVAATLTVHDWQGAVIGTRLYDGHWEVSGLVRWSPR
jgi:hypothetical protein